MPMKKLTSTLILLSFLMFFAGYSYAQDCCAKGKVEDKDIKTSTATVMSSVYELTDHKGEKVQFGDFIKDKVVVMNFVFTTCKTICPPMGANFAALKTELGERVKENLAMISISIDPNTDTPERLNTWKNQFDSSDDGIWTMFTGGKSTVDQLLKDLGVFTPLIDEHAPIIMIGSANNDEWIRTNGLASSDVLAGKINQYLDKAKLEFSQKADRTYFTDLVLTNQHGDEFKFYSDLLKDKVVFINPFFAECPGTCPLMHTMMQDVQKHLGDKLGKSVVMLSITVDPVNDTPEKLKDYAASYGARPGWHFLSGSVVNVNAVMKKLGKYVEVREQHDTVLLIGNMNTKLWKKANGLANVSEIIEILDSVIEDVGETD